MAYIAPNTDVYILKQVPLEKSHLHTARFTSPANQQTAFLSYLKSSAFQLSEYSYQRTKKNSIRVGIPADNLYDCNYMMFKNISFGNKWFYAFIDDVEYINNNTSEITYTIDVIQTWMFDYEIEDCYVEREHSETDEKFTNFVPEDFNVKANRVIKRYIKNYHSGDSVFVFYYVPNFTTIAQTNDHPHIIANVTNTIATTDDPASGLYLGYYIITEEITTQKNQGVYGEGSYLGCYAFALELPNGNTQSERDTATLKIASVINFINRTSSNLVAIKCYPRNLMPTVSDFKSVVVSNGNVIFNPETEFTNNDGRTYRPNNNKMYNYPYMNFILSNHEGKQKTYSPELFEYDNQGNIYFKTETSILPDFNFTVYPVSYNNLPNDYENSINCDLEDNNCWSEDSYALYYAQNKQANDTRFFSSALTSALTVLGAVGSAVVTGGASAGMSLMVGLTGVSNLIGAGAENDAKYIEAQNTPDNYNGSFTGHTLQKNGNRFGFTIYQMGVDIDTARNIDNYFSVYGYAVKRVKKPNLFSGAHLRAKWNYLKTKGCTIAAKNNGINENDISELEKIFDNGITFWNVETLGMNSIANYGNFSNSTT